jgi:two-component sensor histidine kinase
LRDLVAAELAPYAARAQIEGPQIIVQAGMVQTLAMLMHELATNAAKHGSLSRENGTVLVRWTVSGSGMEARFKFHWKEMGGPVVSAPSRKGFGSTLLEGAILADKTIRPRTAFDADGFVYELHAPLRAFSDL